MLAAVGDDRNRFLVIASDYPKQRRPTFRLKRDPIADPEVEHLLMRAHLVQEPQPRHNPVVQIDQFFLVEFVDVNFHDCSCANEHSIILASGHSGFVRAGILGPRQRPPLCSQLWRIPLRDSKVQVASFGILSLCI